jgi:hypothetical protein
MSCFLVNVTSMLQAVVKAVDQVRINCRAGGDYWCVTRVTETEDN